MGEIKFQIVIILVMICFVIKLKSSKNFIFQMFQTRHKNGGVVSKGEMSGGFIISPGVHGHQQ